jgi:hypothetical protein
MCGHFVVSFPHGEERGTRVSNHEARMHLILRDAAKTPLFRMRIGCDAGS